MLYGFGGKPQEAIALEYFCFLGRDLNALLPGS